MKTTLESIENCVNRLTIKDVTHRDMNNVVAWMDACGLDEKEREDGYSRLVSDGEYSFSNIEYRVSAYFKM